MKEYENKILEKDDRIQFMEMQKKNDDLQSRIENEMPIDGEMGDLENQQRRLSSFNDNLEPDFGAQRDRQSSL